MKQKFKVTSDLHASSGQRFITFIIDRILFSSIFYFFGIIAVFFAQITNNSQIFEFLERIENINRFLDMLITGFIFAVFYTLFEYTTQRTIGKYISKTMVVLENGEKPNLNTILTRSFCRMIPFDALSYLGNDTRGWHDSISNTYVVDVQKFNNKLNVIKSFNELGKSEDEIIF